MIYLDYQATTPLAPEAWAAMRPWLETDFANPHAPYRAGRAAAAAIEVARDEVLATLLEDTCDPGRLHFTGSATEALNWAIKGIAAGAAPARRRIVTIATEHAAVLDTVRWLAGQGAEAVVLPVDGAGLIDPAAACAAIDTRTALVAVMLVNNEIGVIQRDGLVALAERARAVGAAVVCDAVQGFGRIPLPVAACDLIAVSAHKLHGPKGIGALWVREEFAPVPLLHGGGQEGGVRSGTLSPALCVGFGAAARLAGVRMAEDAAHVARLWVRLRARLGDGWHLNGAADARWHGNLNLRRDGLDAGRLISELRDLAISAGSACASGSGRPSHVLTALGLTDAAARGSIRLGFGRYTSIEEVDAAAALIDAAVARQEQWT